MDFINIALGISTILQAVVGVIFWIVIIWFIWQAVQIVSDYRAMWRDDIGFKRGKIKKAAEKKGIDIVYEAKQTAKGEYDQILDSPEEPSKKDTKRA